MTWDGSGNFSRVHNWQSDANNSIPITDTRMDAEDDNLAAGIEACLTKNGENTPSADLPMATFKHTNIGNATARNHYPAVGQVQDGSFTTSAESGAANAYVLTLSPAITAYATRGLYHFIAGNTNTGASTLNINGVGATAITKNGTTALEAGDITANRAYSVMYDGTRFILLNGFIPTSYGRSIAGVADEAALKALINAEAGVDFQAYNAGLAYLAGLAFTNEATFKAGVNLEPGTDVQAQNAGLAYLAGLAFTNEATFKAGVNLEPGTDVQAQNANLQALAGLVSAADTLGYFTGSGTAALTTLSAFIRTLLDDANQAAAQATLDVDPAGTDNSTNVTLAGSLDYLTLSGQEITRGPIDLTTDVTGVLPVANGGTASAISPFPIFKRKTADTTRASTTTYSDDPDLAAFSLAVGTYSLECELPVYSGNTPGLKFQFQIASGTVSASSMGYILTKDLNGGTTYAGFQNGDITSEFSPTFGTNGEYTLRIRGYVIVSVAAVIDFQWAQATSDALSTAVKAHSHIKFTPVN